MIKRLSLNTTFVFLLFSLLPIHGNCQNPDVSKLVPPQSPVPRYLEDYSDFKYIKQKNLFQNIKYIPIVNNSYISLGSEARFRYEYFKNHKFGFAEQDNNGFLLKRLLFHTDVHLNKYFRVFSQFISGNAYGRHPGPGGADKDLLDMNQLFLEFPISLKNNKLLIRGGRQELSLGANRLFDFREGPNARLSFDGLRITLSGKFNMDLFYIAPVRINQNYFDNYFEKSKKIVGFYFSKSNLFPNHNIDIYGLYNEYPPENNYLTNSERRYSLGVRDFFQYNKFSLDIETTYQMAIINDSIKHSYAVALDLNYRIIEEKDRLGIGILNQLTNGTRGLNFVTFQPLNPTLFNFGNIDLFGKYNLIYVQPFIQFRPSIKDRILFETIFYWRESIFDNIYSPPGFILLDSEKFDGHYMGSQINLTYTVFWNSFLQTGLGYRNFMPGNAFSTQTSAKSVNYLFLSLIWRI